MTVFNDEELKNLLVAECAGIALPQRVIVLYAKPIKSLVTFLSTAEHVEFCRNLGRPLSKAKYQEGPIVN